MDAPAKPETRQPPAAMDRVVAAAILYFAMVFAAGLILGPARVLWLEPYLGQTISVLCEAPLLMMVMAFAAWAAPRWTGLDGGWALFLMVGMIAFVLQQIADLAVGFGLRGMTLADQLAYFATPPGYIYAFTLLVFMLAPLVSRLRQPRRRDESLTAIKGSTSGSA